MRQNNTHAVTYSRNSSARQKSITDQRDETRAACVENGWSVIAELDDPVSASRYATKVRKNWARLQELLPDVDVIVLWEPSRGDRSLASWATFLDSCRTHHVRIHAVSHARTYDPANARDYRSLAEDGVDSVYESDKISLRTRRGHASAAAAGRPHGGVAFGYVRRYDPATKAFVGQYEDPERAAVARDIITSIANGEPLSSIVTRLNRARIPTSRGRIWYHYTLRAIAGNESYRPHPDDPARGCRVHKGTIYIGQWPPLVDERTWQAAQRVLGRDDAERTARKKNPPGRAKHLLSGSSKLLRAACGGNVSASLNRKGRGAAYTCDADRCVSAPMAECDEYVTRLVVARFARRDVRRRWVADDTEVRRAAEELARLRGELREARDSHKFRLAGGAGISLATLVETEMTLEPLIAEAERRATPAGIPLAALQLIDAREFGKDRVRPTFDAMPLPAKRELIADVFTSLTLGPVVTRLTRWMPADERFAIVAERIEHEWRRP